MAVAASNSSSSLSFIASQGKHDVFLSFRGEDTRCIFTCHLYNALCRKNIYTFLDDEAIERGDELSPTLLAAIEGAKLSIVILSENYASSRWCLDELVKIMECKETRQQIVIPVFYHIDPSHVRKQCGTYENAFAKHELHHQFKVQKWRTVLHEVANIGGWDTTNIRLESNLVEDITEDVLKKLNRVRKPEVPKSLVGIDKHVECVESLLCIGSEDVRIVGIWGMGGIGKTTIAETLFKKHSAQFEGFCFLENVREEWKNRGKNELQNKILSRILEDQEEHVRTPSVSSTFVVSRLRRRKVFIVLDDVSDFQQIEDLVGDKAWFGPGSRIIVTTRNKDVLKENDGFYNVKEMNNVEALHLFSLKAFQQDKPRREFIDISTMVVNYAKGNPLALKVLGSFLHSKSQEEWESTLKKLKKIPDVKIHHILSLSFEGLDYEEWQIFLDIACFLKGETKWFVINLLDGCDFSTNIGLRSLENKSLITISGDTVQMHDLIQQSGRQIIREESPKELERRSRLWDHEEIYHVLRGKQVTDHFVETILLDMSEIKDVEISPRAFARMHRLRLLKFYMPDQIRLKRCNVNAPKGLDALPDELRYFRWDNFPMKALPSSFSAENLVELDLRNSLIEKLWEGEQELANLKKLRLSNCKDLLVLPNLSKAKSLEEIHLDNCTSLLFVPSHIFSLDHLLAIDLTCCKELRFIRSDMNSRSLRWLNLNACFGLVDFSITSQNLEYLFLGGTAIKELPSLGRAKNLSCLSLSMCGRLENLPNNLYRMGFDTSINIFGCPKLEKLPPIIDTSWSITTLCLHSCPNLSELPEDLGLLSALTELTVPGSNIETLPLSIKLLSQLRILNICHCKRLRCLPELPQLLQHLDAEGCISLETVSSSTVTTNIQNIFGSPDRISLLRGIQESKISLHQDEYIEKFQFHNCTRLDENARKTIMDEAVIRIKYAAFLSSMADEYDSYHQFHLIFKDSDPESFESSCRRRHISSPMIGIPHWSELQETDRATSIVKINANCCDRCKHSDFAFGLFNSNKEENSGLGFDGRNRICMQQRLGYKCTIRSWSKLWNNDVTVSLPGSRIPRWFIHGTTKTYTSIQLPRPSQLLGFAFCVVLSHKFPPTEMGNVPDIRFECYLEATHKRTGPYQSDCSYSHLLAPEFLSDTVFLWYDAFISNRILEGIKESRDNPKLLFGFYPGNKGIKECGLWPIYVSELEHKHSVKQVELRLVSGKKKLKRKRKRILLPWNCRWQALIMRTNRMRKRKRTNLSSSCRIDGKMSENSDEEQEIQPAKKSRRSQDIDRLEGITTGVEVGGSYFGNQDELRPIRRTEKLRTVPEIFVTY